MRIPAQPAVLAGGAMPLSQVRFEGVSKLSADELTPASEMFLNRVIRLPEAMSIARNVQDIYRNEGYDDVRVRLLLEKVNGGTLVYYVDESRLPDEQADKEVAPEAVTVSAPAVDDVAGEVEAASVDEAAEEQTGFIFDNLVKQAAEQLSEDEVSQEESGAEEKNEEELAPQQATYQEAPAPAPAPELKKVPQKVEESAETPTEKAAPEEPEKSVLSKQTGTLTEVATGIFMLHDGEAAPTKPTPVKEESKPASQTEPQTEPQKTAPAPLEPAQAGKKVRRLPALAPIADPSPIQAPAKPNPANFDAAPTIQGLGNMPVAEESIEIPVSDDDSPAGAASKAMKVLSEHLNMFKNRPQPESGSSLEGGLRSAPIENDEDYCPKDQNCL